MFCLTLPFKLNNNVERCPPHPHSTPVMWGFPPLLAWLCVSPKKKLNHGKSNAAFEKHSRSSSGSRTGDEAGRRSGWLAAMNAPVAGRRMLMTSLRARKNSWSCWLRSKKPGKEYNYIYIYLFFLICFSFCQVVFKNSK